MTTADKTAKKRRPKKIRCGYAEGNTAGHGSLWAAVTLFAFSAFLAFTAFLFLLKSSSSAPTLIGDLVHIDLVVAYGSIRRIAQKKRRGPA